MSDAHWPQRPAHVVDQSSLEQRWICVPAFAERSEYGQAVALIHGKHLKKQLLLACVKVLCQVFDRRMC